MNEYGITPGPWTHSKFRRFNGTTVEQVAAAGGLDVCQVMAERDARAIAEVPAMIEALEDAAFFLRDKAAQLDFLGHKDYASECHERSSQLDALLARIKGESA